MTGPVLVGQFWGLDSDRILKLVLREIILSQEIQMPPGGPPTHGPWPAAIPSVYAATAPASVPPSDADLPDVQRPDRRTDSV